MVTDVAFVLCAGLGERLRPMTLAVPKPLAPLWNRPLLGHTLAALEAWGVREVFVNAHWLGEQVRAFAEGWGGATKVRVLEEPERLGTGGALRGLAPFLRGRPFWLVNGDVAFDVGPGAIEEAFEASGRFGVFKDYLETAAAIEIKMGQGAKPGIGGHLPGSKITDAVSTTRMIPKGVDAISPAPHHDIYSIEDLRQLVYSLKEATDYKKPVIVKIAAVHNCAAIASGIARSGADIIAVDGFRGGTGAAPTRIRDNVGIPIELALASIDTRLREEGIRDNVSIVAAGSIRSSTDLLKAIALGADACYIGTAALLSLGCHLCRSCHQGKCNWGIATQRPELVKRLNPEIGYRRLVGLVTAWKHELQEMMGGMGINSVEALRGNRLMLRGIGLTDRELSVLGIRHAGE